jgi:hypothetical protein
MNLTSIFAVLFAAFLTLAPAAQAVEMPRLPRTVFDVIPPSERVMGPPGKMWVYQPACRIAATPDRRRIVSLAVQEWAFFGFHTVDATDGSERVLPKALTPEMINPNMTPAQGEGEVLLLSAQEHASGKDPTIAGYWSATPDGQAILTSQNTAWTGPSGTNANWVQPWSAAFVSWVMCEAGLGDPSQFRRSIAHQEYIDQAIRARYGTEPGASYVAYNPGEEPISPGDLLCTAWGTRDYRRIEDRVVDAGIYAPTHCDIVVKTTADRVLIIGGNVLGSVTLTILPMATGFGRYAHPVSEATIEGGRPVFAHLQLKAPPIEADALDHSRTVKALEAPATVAAGQAVASGTPATVAPAPTGAPAAVASVPAEPPPAPTGASSASPASAAGESTPAAASSADLPPTTQPPPTASEPSPP